MERNFKKRMRMRERRKGEKKKGEAERKNLEWREWHFLEMHNQMHTAPDAYRDWIENDSQEIRLHEKNVKWFMGPNRTQTG